MMPKPYIPKSMYNIFYTTCHTVKLRIHYSWCQKKNQKKRFLCLESYLLLILPRNILFIHNFFCFQIIIWIKKKPFPVFFILCVYVDFSCAPSTFAIDNIFLLTYNMKIVLFHWNLLKFHLIQFSLHYVFTFPNIFIHFLMILTWFFIYFLRKKNYRCANPWKWRLFDRWDHHYELLGKMLNDPKSMIKFWCKEIVFEWKCFIRYLIGVLTIITCCFLCKSF